MDILESFDFLGDMSGCCLIGAAVLLILLACGACVFGLVLIDAI